MLSETVDVKYLSIQKSSAASALCIMWTVCKPGYPPPKKNAQHFYKMAGEKKEKEKHNYCCTDDPADVVNKYAANIAEWEKKKRKLSGGGGLLGWLKHLLWQLRSVWSLEEPELRLRKGQKNPTQYCNELTIYIQTPFFSNLEMFLRSWMTLNGSNSSFNSTWFWRRRKKKRSFRV